MSPWSMLVQVVQRAPSSPCVYNVGSTLRCLRSIVCSHDEKEHCAGQQALLPKREMCTRMFGARVGSSMVSPGRPEGRSGRCVRLLSTVPLEPSLATASPHTRCPSVAKADVSNCSTILLCTVSTLGQTFSSTPPTPPTPYRTPVTFNYHHPVVDGLAT